MKNKSIGIIILFLVSFQFSYAQDIGTFVIKPTCSGVCNGSYEYTIDTTKLNKLITNWSYPFQVEYKNVISDEIEHSTIESNGKLILNNLCSGDYIITIYLSDLCKYEINTKIDIANLSITGKVKKETLNGCNDGRIDLSITCGSGDYTYTWINSRKPNKVPYRKNLPPGDYTVTVLDNITQQTATKTFTVGYGRAFYIYGVKNITGCKSSKNPDDLGLFLLSNIYVGDSLEVTLIDPNGSPRNITGNRIIRDLNIFGIYTVIVKNLTTACELSLTQEILDLSGAPFSVSISDKRNIKNCMVRKFRGYLSINIEPSDIYTYKWSGPNNFTSTSKDISGLLTGNYTVTVTNSKGCSISLSEMKKQTNQMTQFIVEILIKIFPC